MEALTAVLLAASLAAASPKDKNGEVASLRIHAFRASIWISIDASGRFKLREELPDDVARKPRKLSKRLGKAAVQKLLRDAEHAGFFDLEERYAESAAATTSYRIELLSDLGRKAVAVYGEPPPAFRAVIDRIEELYGKPLLPGLAKGAVRPRAPPSTPDVNGATPKDDRSKEWED